MMWQAFALDIETANASPDAAEYWIRQCYQPDTFLTWKFETIGKRIKEAYEAKLQHLGLLDASPIISVGIKSATHWLCFHAFFEYAPNLLNGATVQGFSDISDLLIALRDVLDGYCDESTVITGHNILGFDLRKLRRAYGCSNIRPPQVLKNLAQPVFDTMQCYGRHFSVDRRDFKYASLDEVLEAFGLESHKQIISGIMVPELYRQADYATLIQYQLLDVAREWTLYLRMSGSALDMR